MEYNSTDPDFSVSRLLGIACPIDSAEHNDNTLEDTALKASQEENKAGHSIDGSSLPAGVLVPPPEEVTHVPQTIVRDGNVYQIVRKSAPSETISYQGVLYQAVRNYIPLGPVDRPVGPRPRPPPGWVDPRPGPGIKPPVGLPGEPLAAPGLTGPNIGPTIRPPIGAIGGPTPTGLPPPGPPYVAPVFRSVPPPPPPGSDLSDTISTSSSSGRSRSGSESDSDSDSSSIYCNLNSAAGNEWKRQKEIDGAKNKYLDRLMCLTGLEDAKALFLDVKARIDANYRRHDIVTSPTSSTSGEDSIKGKDTAADKALAGPKLNEEDTVKGGKKITTDRHSDNEAPPEVVHAEETTEETASGANDSDADDEKSKSFSPSRNHAEEPTRNIIGPPLAPKLSPSDIQPNRIHKLDENGPKSESQVNSIVDLMHATPKKKKFGDMRGKAFSSEKFDVAFLGNAGTGNSPRLHSHPTLS
jgi:hypothetical protein